MKTVAIIPAYNEEKHIVETIVGVKKYSKDIIVIDDGSSDATYELAKKAQVTAIKHVINLGKGASLITAIEYAISQDFDSFILIDADLQHDPDEIPKFLDALRDGNDIVFGYRTMKKNMPSILRFGNYIINRSTRFLYGLDLNDTTCGYRALTAETYKKIKWEASGYFVEAEMIANTGKNNLKFTQIPIQTIYSDKYKGTTVLDGIKIVWNMLLWRLRR